MLPALSTTQLHLVSRQARAAGAESRENQSFLSPGPCPGLCGLQDAAKDAELRQRGAGAGAGHRVRHCLRIRRAMGVAQQPRTPLVRVAFQARSQQIGIPANRANRASQPPPRMPPPPACVQPTLRVACKEDRGARGRPSRRHQRRPPALPRCAPRKGMGPGACGCLPAGCK